MLKKSIVLIGVSLNLLFGISYLLGDIQVDTQQASESQPGPLSPPAGDLSSDSDALA
ncbi:hypothetical protein [Mesobacillus thioparans]|uniref:hypothetical protein n=1 Tax=Mesobacillus thioparans TaxID=370439 RepID=UPI0039F0F492